MKTFDLIVAVDQKNGIGKNGQMPWALSGDMHHFKSVTAGSASKGKINAVVMGRATWESIPLKFRPLAGRLNVVLTKNAHYQLPEGVLKAHSLEDAMAIFESLKYQERIDQVFIMGGGSVYHEAISHPLCRKIYLTRIDSDFSCDRFFPEITKNFEQIESSSPQTDHGVRYTFFVYRRI